MNKILTVTAIYHVLSHITIAKVLEVKGFYDCCYFIAGEQDEPMLVRESMGWLQRQSKKKKVWILKFDTESNQFIKLTKEQR